MQMRLNSAKIFSGAIVAAAFACGLVPTLAAADSITASVPTVLDQQVVHNAPSCAAPSVTVTPYVYDGHMDSFDVNVSDARYVSIAGRVGDFGIPLQLMTRQSQNGGVRIHIDIPSTYIRGTVPVSMLMLSAQNGICAATVNFAMTGPAPVISHPTTPIATPPANGTGSMQPQEGTTSTSTVGGLPTGSGSVVAGPFSSIAGSISRICQLNQGAYELWLTLLAIYFIFVLATIFSDIPTLRESNTLAATAILVPFVALFAFWLTIPECRAASWTGVIASLIAVGGLAAIYREEAFEKTVEKVRQLPAPAVLQSLTAAPTEAAKKTDKVENKKK